MYHQCEEKNIQVHAYLQEHKAKPPKVVFLIPSMLLIQLKILPDFYSQDFSVPSVVFLVQSSIAFV